MKTIYDIYKLLLLMELIKTIDNLTFVALQKYISDYKLFLSENEFPKVAFKKNSEQSIIVLNYTLFFFEQVQKKLVDNMDQVSYQNIYNKLYEINNLWKAIIESL